MNRIVGAIREMAEANSSALAVVGSARTLSYGELLRLVFAIGNHLVDRGMPPGSRLFLNIFDPDLRLVVSLAAIHAGMIPYVLTELGDLRGGIDYDFIISAPLPYAKGLPADLIVDEAVMHGRLVDDRLREFPDRGEDEILFLAGTSGTTGKRKLVVARLGAYLLRQEAANGRPEPVGKGDRVLMTVGDATKFGFGRAIHLLTKGATILRREADMSRTLANANLYGVTHIHTTPADLGAMIRVMEATEVRAPSVRIIELAGSLFPARLVERAGQVFDARLRVVYGSSEVGGISRAFIDPAKFRPGYVGELNAGVELVGVGTLEAPAQIVIANNRGLFCEYYADGQIVREEKPFYTMPDIGYIDHGSLFLVGRDDEAVNFSGNKYAFSTIEMALRAVAGVEDIGLANTPADWGRPGLVIGVVGEGIELGALADIVCSAINFPDARPGLFLFGLPAIGRNQMGKVDRTALLNAYRSLARSH